MPIILREAHTSVDLEKVFGLRRQFLCNVGDSGGDSLDVFDPYDAYPDTCNIIALKDMKGVGCVRVAFANPLGCPISQYISIEPFIKQKNLAPSSLASINWLCLAPGFMQSTDIFMGLVKMLIAYLRRHEVRHCIALLQSDIYALMKPLGLEAIAPAFRPNNVQQSLVPAYLDVDRLPRNVRELYHSPIELFLNESSERRIYRKGDVIIRRGELGEAAFVVMRGSVRTAQADPGEPYPLPDFRKEVNFERVDYLLGPGDLFGELALLDRGPHVSTIVCHSREVDVMVWSQEQFIHQLHEDNDKAIKIAKIIGSRLRTVSTGIHHEKPGLELVGWVLLDASRRGRKAVDLNWLAAQTGLWRHEAEALLKSVGCPIQLSDPNHVHVKDVEQFVRKLNKADRTQGLAN